MLSVPYNGHRAQLALAAPLMIAQIDDALAHGFAGERFFPPTILTDDPFVADEISLPQVSLQPPAADASQLTNIEIDLSKRITPNTGIIIGDGWQRLRAPGVPSVGGLGPLRTGAQYQLFIDGPRQALGLLGFSVTWGHTGRAAVGAPDFTTLSPTFDFGKGFGDIPRSLPYLRPFAITGNLGFDFPTQATTAGVPNPNQLRLRFRIQPSLHRMLREGHRAPPALQSADPLVEVSFSTPISRTSANQTAGTIQPGMIWASPYFQIGAEAVIPANRLTGHGYGGVVQLHFYLDDIFSRSIGRPISEWW